jgi:hypothetical protein
MKVVTLSVVALALSSCAKVTPLAESPTRAPSPRPSASPSGGASVEAASIVRIHGYVSFPCRLTTLGSPSGIRVIFKTPTGVLLGKATTRRRQYATREDGACAQRAAYSIVLPRRPAYVARDPLHNRDLIARLRDLEAAGFRWDFKY